MVGFGCELLETIIDNQHLLRRNDTNEDLENVERSARDE